MTFKKVINHLAVGTTLVTNYNIAVGVDSTAMGQTSITDPNVTTGGRIRAIKICTSASNLNTVGIECAVCLQYLLPSQASVDPLAIGGSNQRNQVLKTWHKGLAQDDSLNINEWVKIPKKFQRLKEGMIWRITISTNGVARTESSMFIYKVRL